MPIRHDDRERRPPMKERLQALLAEYGPTALWVYFSIFAVVLVGFAVAITLGANVEGAAETAGVWGAAYLATKLTQPFRIAATLAMTPLVVRLARRARGERSPDAVRVREE